MTSGSRFKIRKEGDVVYIERVLSDAEKKVGNFAAMELHKSKDGYSGKEHVVVAGYTLDRLVNYAYRCTFDFPVEVSVLNESRIEGRISIPPDNAKMDRKKCTYNMPQSWSPFVWIPE